MPIWLRKFTYKRLEKHYEEVNKQNSSNSSNSSTNYNIDMANPDKSLLNNSNVVTPPSYVTQRSKK